MVAFIVVCVFMVLTILIQKPQGGGLSAAFGGGAASSGQTAFGTKTGDALTVFTVLVFVTFLVTAVLLNLGMKPPGKVSESPAATTAPASEGAATSPAQAIETAPAPAAAPEGTPATTPSTTPATSPAPSDPAPIEPAPGTNPK